MVGVAPRQERVRRLRLPTHLPDHTETEARVALHVHRGSKLKTRGELPVDAAAQGRGESDIGQMIATILRRVRVARAKRSSAVD